MNPGASTQAWELLEASGLLNLYVIEGGINRWLAMYPLDPCVARRKEGNEPSDREELAHTFRLAVGERDDSAHPYTVHREPFTPCAEREEGADGKARIALFPKYRFARKVQLERKVAVKGGCG